MFRLFALFCFTAVFTFSAVFAQDEPGTTKIKATPEILSLFEESLQSLSQAETNPRIGGLFQLLGFAVSFDDKAPAQKIVDTLLALAPSIEPEELRHHLYMGIANTFCDMEKYPEAIAVLDRISSPDVRRASQVEIASIILGPEDKASQPFDTSELLRQAIGGAVDAKDPFIEGMARALLGREFARQGKLNEATAAFSEALNTTPKIEDAEKQGRVFELVLYCQVLYGQVSDAMTTLQTVTDPAIKPVLTYTLVSELIQREKYNEAETLIKTLPSGDMKDNLLGSFVLATIKTITDAKVGELAALVSTDELRERFLQITTAQLQKNGRSDVAAQVGKRLKEPAVAEMSLFIGKVELLLEEKKFAEAIQFVDESEENEAIQQHLKRQILVSQYHETRDESVAGQIEAIFTRNERVAIMELREEAKQAAEVADFTERIDMLFAIFQEQSQFFDFVGARQTVKLVAEQLDKGTEPVQNIRDRLLLARLQVELRDKEGAKANLGKLMQRLSAVNDLNELKGLVPTPGNGSTIEESAIKDQLFPIYFVTANLLAQADAPAESQAAFVKARELAMAEPVAAVKSEKLLILAQFLAEEQK